MAYYYVKNGGTATGDAGRYASQQTGSFATLGAANYYNDIAAMLATLTTAPDHGDFICLSDLHSYNNNTGRTLFNTNMSISTGELPLTIISVDDANCDAYKPATTVQESNTGATGTVNFSICGSAADSSAFAFLGCYFTAARNLYFSGSSAYYFRDCTLETNGTTDGIAFSLSGAGEVEDCTIKQSGSHSGQRGIYGNNSGYRLSNCTFTSAIAVDDVVNYMQFYSLIEDCDFSGVTCTKIYSVGGEYVGTNIHLRRCKLPTGMTTISNHGSKYPTSRELITETADTSAAAEYQYRLEQGHNLLEDETSIYRNSSTAFPSGTQISLKCTTSTQASHQSPFIIDFPTRYASLSTAGDDVLRIYLMSSSALTDADVRVEAIYADGTSKHQRNKARSADYDPFATGTTLTTNTETWTGYTSENRYQIDVDTSGDAGADCVPRIRVYVAKPSATMYFCPTVTGS